VLVERGDAEVGAVEHVDEVVDVDVVVGRELAAEGAVVGVRVDGDDPVAPRVGEQRAEQRGQRRLAGRDRRRPFAGRAMEGVEVGGAHSVAWPAGRAPRVP
jgi:hypothetical protein